MSGTPLIAFSSGEATVCSSVCADAPGYTACTVTTGGAISGYWATGSERIAASPASTMKVEMTAAKSGRSMKKRDNMGVPSRLLGRGAVGGRSRFFSAGCRRRFGARQLDRRARLQPGDAVDDHVVAGIQAGFDDEKIAPIAVDPVADTDRPWL